MTCDRLTEWPSDWMIEWPNDQTTKLSNDQMTKWLGDMMTRSFADDWPYGIFQYKINFISGNMFIFTSIYFQEKNNKHQTTLLYLVLCIFNLTVLGRRWRWWCRDVRLVTQTLSWACQHQFCTNYSCFAPSGRTLRSGQVTKVSVRGRVCRLVTWRHACVSCRAWNEDCRRLREVLQSQRRPLLVPSSLC